MNPDNNQKIRELLDDYLQMYAFRDDRLTACFSEDFSGITGSGDTLVKDREEWVAITRQDFAQVKDPIRIELKDLAIQLLADTIGVATSFFTIHLPIKDHILSQKTARLVLIFRLEADDWKISHSSISIPFAMAQEGEIYPLKDMAERNQYLEKLVVERTTQLSEANLSLQQANAKLAREIAEHKQTMDVLRESEAHYRLLTENASDVVWKLDADYRFTYISPADERLRGYRADEVIGHHVYELFDEEGIELVTKIARQRREAEQRGVKTGTLTFEAKHRCKDGRWLWAEISYTPEKDTHGITKGFYGISREISGRKLAEENLNQAKTAAEEANKAKSHFLATISHEIRTPLNSLVGFSSLARKTTDPVKLDQYHSILEQSSRSLMELVNDILDMSKIEAGRMEFESVPFNLRQLVGILEEQYGHLAEHKDLEFQLAVTDNVPTWVLGDPTRLRQILSNLLANAIKFTENGTVSCTVSLADQIDGESESMIHFKVRDTGIGIPETKLALLFQPFRQLDPTITRKFGGSGLGLAIVQNLATLMNGSITVDSREGIGSSFAVTLPFQETEPVAVSPLAPTLLLASGTALVVEDNSFSRQLLSDILESLGQQVMQAGDGWQALEALDQQHFNLVLLDIRMPGIDGIEVARRIRSRECERSEMHVPIIAITADADAETREACLDAGINGVLAKPVIPEQLAKAIAEQCGGSFASSIEKELLLNLQTRTDLGNNNERARQYREMLQQDINEELHSLRTALECESRDDLGRAAHTLKGLFGHLADQEPAQLATWLQHNAPTARPEQLSQVIEQLMKGQAE